MLYKFKCALEDNTPDWRDIEVNLHSDPRWAASFAAEAFAEEKDERSGGEAWDHGDERVVLVVGEDEKVQKFEVSCEIEKDFTAYEIDA